MNSENFQHLENSLRQPLEKERPRPGFEARLQAMAHHELKPVRQIKRSRLWLAVPACAALFILFLITASQNPAPTSVVQVVPLESMDPVEEKVVLTVSEDSPLRQEARGFEKDARRTADFLFKALPSISISEKEPLD